MLIEPLAQAWNLSATPLREALRTLAGEGLVVLDAQRGARIAPVSEQELTEVYELRLIVEPLAFRLSVLASDEAWLDRLDAAWAALAPDAWATPQPAGPRAGPHGFPSRPRRELRLRTRCCGSLPC